MEGSRDAKSERLFMLYVAPITLILCVQEKIWLFSMSQRRKFELHQNFRRSLLEKKDTATVKNCKKITMGGVQRWLDIEI